MGLVWSRSKSSRPPCPPPSCGQDQALSGPLVGAVGASVWSDIEEEGPFVSTEDTKPDMDIKPSQWGRAQTRERHLREQAADGEFYQVVQETPLSPQSVRGLCHRVVIVRAQVHRAASSEEEPSAGAQSPVPALCSSSCSSSLSPSPPGIQTPSEKQEQAEGELSPGDGTSDETSVSSDEDGECHTQTELSQGEASSCHDLSDWDDCFEPELCQEELMNWDADSTREDLHVSSQESEHLTHITSGSELSIFSFGPSPLPQEDDWDKLSILELYEEGGRAGVAADSLTVHVPREAWVEAQALESLQASLPSLYDQGSVAQRGPKAGPAAPRKWHGRLRQALRALRARRALRALRGLLHCPCLRPQTRVVSVPEPGWPADRGRPGTAQGPRETHVQPFF